MDEVKGYLEYDGDIYKTLIPQHYSLTLFISA